MPRLDEDPEQRIKLIAHTLEQRGLELFKLYYGRTPDSLERAKIRREALSEAKNLNWYLALYIAEAVLIIHLLSKHL